MINSLKSKYYNYIILMWYFICHFFPINLYFWIVFFYIMIAKEISKINFFFSISLNFKIFFLNCRNDFVSRWFLFFSFIKDSLRGSKLLKVHFEGFTARFPKSRSRQNGSRWYAMKSQSLEGLREQSCGTTIDRMNRYCYDRYSMNIVFCIEKITFKLCEEIFIRFIDCKMFMIDHILYAWKFYC